VQKIVLALSEIPEVGLKFKEPPSPPTAVRERIGIFDAIVLYFSALVSNLIGIPKKAWNQAKERLIKGVENYVQNRTFQSESKLVVRYGGRLREEDFAGSASQRIRAIESDSGVEVRKLGASLREQCSGQLTAILLEMKWATRSLTFAECQQLWPLARWSHPTPHRC
jgi:hypothetical protein